MTFIIDGFSMFIILKQAKIVQQNKLSLLNKVMAKITLDYTVFTRGSRV